MEVLLALATAFGYGASDFIAGLGGRRAHPTAVALLSQPPSLVVALTAVLVFPGRPDAVALEWGVLAGLGIGTGVAALYRGLTTSPMCIAAPVSGVVSSLIPAMVGIATGAPLSGLDYAGVALAVPGCALVSSTVAAPGTTSLHRTGVTGGAVSGCGFATQYIALSQPEASAGAWPLVSAEVTAALFIATLGRRSSCPPGAWRAGIGPALVAGTLGGMATLLYLLATDRGPLPVIAVLTGLYPAVTVVLARTVLGEGWSRLQQAGLLIAALSVVLISAP